MPGTAVLAISVKTNRTKRRLLTAY